MNEVRRSTAVALARAEEGAQRDTVIELRHAGVALGGRSVWHDVSLQIHDGEFIAVLGPNGAGKTTFIKALLGLIPLSSGSITVLGHAAVHGNPAVGYVPQRRSFGAEVHVRGRDVVRLGLDGAQWGTPLPGLGSLWQSARSREQQRRVQSVIELVGAARYADRPIGELSGGEQQRLLIAQALVTRPRVLLLDEPLDSLDLRNQGEMSGVISRISRESDTAVLLVAHDVNPLLPYVDRVCYVAHGHMAIGRPKEIITTASLTRLYDAPVEVLQASDGRLVVVGQPEGDHGHGHHGHDG